MGTLHKNIRAVALHVDVLAIQEEDSVVGEVYALLENGSHITLSVGKSSTVFIRVWAPSSMIYFQVFHKDEDSPTSAGNAHATLHKTNWSPRHFVRALSRAIEKFQAMKRDDVLREERIRNTHLFRDDYWYIRVTEDISPSGDMFVRAESMCVEPDGAITFRHDEAREHTRIASGKWIAVYRAAIEITHVQNAVS